MRNNPAFTSKNRSKPYTKRSHKRISGAWMGMFNIVGLLYPRAWKYPDVHVRLTNTMCEQHNL